MGQASSLFILYNVNNIRDAVCKGVLTYKLYGKGKFSSSFIASRKNFTIDAPNTQTL